jgi:Domain of unknown function (DUF4129)
VKPARAGTSAVVAVLAAAGLMLVLVTWAASIGPDRVVSGGHVERIRSDEPSFATQSADPDADNTDDRTRQRDEPPGWLGTIAFVLELITVGVVVFLLGRALRRLRQLRLFRTRRGRRRAELVDFEVLGTADEVADVIEEDAPQQRALLEEGEPRNAIVACWHRFEQQATRGGVVRRPWQTTGEFVLGVLDLVGADRGAVSRLADLYREARFSDHPMTDDHRRNALEALDTIHRSLGPTRVVTR